MIAPANLLLTVLFGYYSSNLSTGSNCISSILRVNWGFSRDNILAYNFDSILCICLSIDYYYSNFLWSLWICNCFFFLILTGSLSTSLIYELWDSDEGALTDPWSLGTRFTFYVNYPISRE